MSREERAEQVSETDVAVVGMAGRFPGARNLEQFWENLREGVESISALTTEELLAAGATAELLENPDFVRVSSSLDDVELFDAPFFGLNPREAEILDPQQRIFLECAWEALEGAGYNPEKYPGAIGVFAGVSLSTYLMSLYANRGLLGATTYYQIIMANDKDHLPTRVSYKLNLKGPSVNVQTSCSTSLVAVHLAVQSLLNGESDMALAGGVSVSVPQRRGYLYQEGNISSPDGHCRAFDADARGTVGGNGAGVVLLKRLADALEDGDHVRAVIKGSAINNDGALKVGYTAPSVEGQAKVIAEALSMAEVEPETVTYIEAHGTGTSLGDPIEIAALSKAFGARTSRRGFCAVGSVKTNIGHLDAAAGVAGLIKTVLMLENKLIPPSLHFVRPNPKINFAESPFFVNARLREWERGEAPRRAGVSSFGIGGTNAHVVVEESPARSSAAAASRPWHLLVWSARSGAALERMTENLAAHLRRHEGEDLSDVCYTLQAGRKTFEHRRVLVCRDAADALSALSPPDSKRVLTDVQKPRERPVVFMFSGQGAQRVGMGRELYRHEAVFREHFDRCAELLKPQLGLDLREVLDPPAGREEEAARRLDQTDVTQPALFAVEYALARVWMAWGVKPSAMIGHSLGEYVAACLAGVFTPEEALGLVAARGRLMQQLPEGAMLAVMVGEEEARRLAGASGLSLAAVNGPSLCTLSGGPAEVSELEKRLQYGGVGSRRLRTSRAFHSTMMEPLLGPFVELFGSIRLNPPSIPYVSNLTGGWVTAEEATSPRYWANHLRREVRFADGLDLLLGEPDQVLLEVGPGQTLSALVRRHPKKGARHLALSSMPQAREDQSELADVLKALGQLWQAGIDVDWDAFHAGERRRRLILPTYPFERKRYWVGGEEHAATTTREDEHASAATTHEAAVEGSQARAESATADGGATAGGRVVPAQPGAFDAPAQTPEYAPDDHAETRVQTAAPASRHAGANGNGHAQGSAPERLVALQLELMQRQLELLRQRREAGGGEPAERP